MKEKKPGSKEKKKGLRAYWGEPIGDMSPEELEEWVDQWPVSGEEKKKIKEELLGSGETGNGEDEPKE